MIVKTYPNIIRISLCQTWLPLVHAYSNFHKYHLLFKTSFDEVCYLIWNKGYKMELSISLINKMLRQYKMISICLLSVQTQVVALSRHGLYVA